MGQRLGQCCALGNADLVVDRPPLGPQPFAAQRLGDIRAQMCTMQVQQPPFRPRIEHKAHKGRGIPPGRDRLEPDVAGSLGGAVAHAPRGQAAIRAQAGKGLDPGGGGEDQSRHTLKRQALPKGRDLHQGQDRHRDRPAFGTQRLGKAVRGRARAGQDHKGRAIVRHEPECYLPKRQPATRRPMPRSLTILGLESSCDDTGAAVLRRDGEKAVILSNVVASQTDLHAAFGGVVPEIAARAHAEKLDIMVEQALAEAGVALCEIDAVAVTAGPGLIGGVLSGVMAAKGLAMGLGKPLVGVNHLAGHALTPVLTDGMRFPYLMLLVSGGHCQFLRVDGPQDFRRLGGTIDDAPGEAFDKVARLLGLPQPGGPAVEGAARAGDPARFDLPRPLMDRPGCDMSFSGLKTAVLRVRDDLVAAQGGLSEQDRADLCAGFQAAVADVLAGKSARALEGQGALTGFAVAGGVAANASLRARLDAVAAAAGLPFVAPPLALCTDNAAMIAFAGLLLHDAGARDDLTLSARPRWPLDAAAAPLLGSGKKGAKA